jgi:hypothetical protein
LKHALHSLSTDGGREIDERDEHSEKTHSSMEERCDPTSNRTSQIVSHPAKQPKFNRSILFGIINDGRFPKYNVIEMVLESTKNG